MLPIDKDDAFEDIEKGRRRLEMDKLNEPSIENLGKSRITINYNGPVMQFHPTENKSNSLDRDKNFINTIGSIAKITCKAIYTGTKLIGLSAPVALPLLLSNNKTKQILLDKISDKKVITIDKKKKEYFDSLKEKDGIFYLVYVNDMNKTPLSDYLNSINESIEIDKMFYFNKHNKFVDFFIQYLKRNNVMIKYFESKKCENDTIMEIEYLLSRIKKRLYIKIKSYAIRKTSTEQRVDEIEDSRIEILNR